MWYTSSMLMRFPLWLPLLKRLRLAAALITFFLIARASIVQAADLNTRTITQNTGMGVNGTTDRVRTVLDSVNTQCIPAACGDFDTNAPFTNPSNPFVKNADCSAASNAQLLPCAAQQDPALPAGFDVPNNQFGKGVPCGPDDSSGPPFPYPCASPGSVNVKIFDQGMIHNPDNAGATTGEDFFYIAPTHSAAPPGAPFQKIQSTPFGNIRIHHIEFGFTVRENAVPQGSGTCTTVDGCTANDSELIKYFFVMDTITDSNGRMVGAAQGTFNLFMNDSHVQFLCQVNSTTNSAKQTGTFTANNSGMIECLNSDGTDCPGPAMNPAWFQQVSICP